MSNLIQLVKPQPTGEYALCETNAGINWHIRALTTAGKKLGGGADTKTLCGLIASWDLGPKIDIKRLSDQVECRECRRDYLLVLEQKGMNNGHVDGKPTTAG